MKRASIWVLVLQGLAGGIAYGQTYAPPEIEWQRSFGGDQEESLAAIAQTRDGGYIIGGTSWSGISGNKTNAPLGGVSVWDETAGDWWVIRLDANGNELWQRSYGSTNADRLFAVQPTDDGGFLLAGTSDGGKAIKIDGEGNVVWQQSFAEASPEDARQTADGGFVLAGTAAGPGDGARIYYGGGDYWIARLDRNGTKLWESSFGGTNVDHCRVVRQTTDGGFILGGETYSGASGNKTSTNFSPAGYNGANGGVIDYWIVRVDTNGTKLWELELGSQDTDRMFSLDTTVDGGFVLGGYAFATVGGNKTAPGYYPTYDYWMVRLTADGTILWDRAFGGTDNDRMGTVRQSRDGSFLLAGTSATPPGEGKNAPSYGLGDLWVIRTDPNGNRLWDMSYGGSNSEAGSVTRSTWGLVCEGSDGDLLVGIDSRSGADGNKTTPCSDANCVWNDFWILKLRVSYCLAFQTNLPGRGSIIATPSPGTNGCYAPGTVVTITAIPEPGFTFAGWIGPQGGTNNPLTLTLFSNVWLRADFAAPGSPAVAFAPPVLTNAAPECRDVTLTQPLQVWNSGGGLLNYTLTPSVPWLTVSPGTGSSVGQTNTHTVTCLSSALASGPYTGVITLQSTDDPGFSATVEVRLQVEAQPAPVLRVPSRNRRQPKAPFQFFVRGTSNCVYVTEFSTDLNAWTCLQTNRAGAAEIEVVDPAITNTVQRFYRSRIFR